MEYLYGDYAMCDNCRYMMSNSQAGAGTEIEGVDAVRKKNFTTICAFIKREFPAANTVLDVGCSRGIFLNTAGKAGLTPTGLEPDKRLAEFCRAQGYNVLDGFFPDAEALSGKIYDVIIFNDSFEHIPNLQNIIEGIKKHLHPVHGIVIVNIPTSDGLMFNLAFFLNKIGIRAPFDRLWQNGFVSPHLHYFNRRSLRLLFEKNGFVTRASYPLPYYLMKGLWRRVSCKSPFALSVVIWFALTLMYPFFRIRSDCFAAYFSLNGKSCVSHGARP
jgi:2-polyprenyl-3-methyl-5-hydroxy-6-metoxy-1,4-benzoquinol methylase